MSLNELEGQQRYFYPLITCSGGHCENVEASALSSVVRSLLKRKQLMRSEGKSLLPLGQADQLI